MDARRLLSRIRTEAFSGYYVVRAGMVGIDPPSTVAQIVSALGAYGPAGAAGRIGAVRGGARTGLVDDRGALSFTDLDERSNALAHVLLERGITAGDSVGLLMRNHRGFVDALFATAKIGARTVLLNTDFAAPQVRDVCAREGVALLVHDEEFTGRVGLYDPAFGAITAWTDQPDPSSLCLDALIASAPRTLPPKPAHRQHIVLLTSGTTGTPKGAPRELGWSMVIPGGYLSKIPFRAGRPVLLAAPAFHAWGLLNTGIALGLTDTLIMQRRFDPRVVLDTLEQARCDALVTVPILLARLLDLGADEIRSRDLSALRIIAVAGSALSADLGTRAMDVFGDVVYNMYGSTEVAYATIATPADLRAAPGCAGRPPLGTTVELLSESDEPVPRGEVGRIFVGNGAEFGGYTGGGTKQVVRGLMSSGDVGHFDADGRLFVEGRDDDMIVSGGENVFPKEIEDLLDVHPAISESAVLGVADEEFGRRLRAFVVLAPAASLTADEVREHVKANLARYKVPRDVVFLPELPRNPTGKILKRELAVE